MRRHGAGEKSFHPAVVGDLALTYEGFEVTTEPDVSFLVYTAEPGSPSEERLRLLASWAANQDASRGQEPEAAVGTALHETGGSTP